jgi:CrcB protein
LKNVFEILIIAFGGGLGSVARYIIGILIPSEFKNKYALNTFIVNILGALLLGLVNSTSLSRNFVLLFADGFLGAFTTFSAIMLEGNTMIRKRRWLASILYITITVVLGILGYTLGRLIF